MCCYATWPKEGKDIVVFGREIGRDCLLLDSATLGAIKTDHWKRDFEVGGGGNVSREMRSR